MCWCGRCSRAAVKALSPAPLLPLLPLAASECPPDRSAAALPQERLCTSQTYHSSLSTPRVSIAGHARHRAVSWSRVQCACG
eukprot:2006577-Rhodomonas_salina.1